ncbi:MAG: FadR/GntR family transcriptional regulator [Candidatus Fimivivens sp.]
MSGRSFSLAEQAAGHIMDMIFVEQRFQADDKLPNELQLAQELGISRVTLREAIRMLCARSVVEIRRGRGTYVTAATGEFISSKADFSMVVNVHASNQDMLDIRMMIEPTAAYYAAKRATEKEIQRIRELSTEIEQTIAAGKNRIKVEQDFHNAIAQASHNPFVKELMPIINRAIYSAVANFDKDTNLVALSLNDHQEIVRFIEARNANGAYAAMRLHIIHAFEIAHIDLETP